MMAIVHLNGYKIANPTVLGRMGDEEIQQLFLGYGHIPLFIEGDAPKLMHRQMADAMDQAIESIRAIQRTARDGRKTSDRPKWPIGPAAQHG
jgi:xylulose-5-phosphate/fructose-6-phosphate phosphoketolase